MFKCTPIILREATETKYQLARALSKKAGMKKSLSVDYYRTERRIWQFAQRAAVRGSGWDGPLFLLSCACSFLEKVTTLSGD